MLNTRVYKTKSHTASAEKTKHFFLLSLLLLAVYFVIAPATVRAASAVIYLQSDLGPTDNSMWANQGDFAPICNGTGRQPAFAGFGFGSQVYRQCSLSWKHRQQPAQHRTQLCFSC